MCVYIYIYIYIYIYVCVCVYYEEMKLLQERPRDVKMSYLQISTIYKIEDGGKKIAIVFFISSKL